MMLNPMSVIFTFSISKQSYDANCRLSILTKKESEGITGSISLIAKLTVHLAYVSALMHLRVIQHYKTLVTFPRIYLAEIPTD